MRHLSLAELLELHECVLAQTGGLAGVRDLDALQSAQAQPRMAFGGTDLYRSLAEKAAALTYSLVLNHPFVDGNKRTGHAAMEVFLQRNGFEMQATVADSESVMLDLAAGALSRAQLLSWIQRSMISLLPE